uniref:Peroxinectin n=1 Tax=Pacifastacus leniusculus TaxID=6720 RepID=Q26059_PACLE|nr:peroxinectin [Pacifastacus leniusculus]
MRQWSWLWVVVLGALVASQEPVDDSGEVVIDELPVARVVRQINFPGNQRRPPVGGNRPPTGGRLTGTPGGGGAGCNCVPAVVCASELDQLKDTCTTGGGAPGVCCPANALTAAAPAKGTADNRIFSGATVSVSLNPLDPKMMEASFKKGLELSNKIKQIEQNLIKNSVVLSSFTPAGQHLRVFSVSPQAKAMDRRANAIIAASTNLVDDFNLDQRQGSFGLRTLPVSGTDLGQMCPQNPTCTPNSKYRTIDGSCNNLANPTWGMSNTPNQRILPPTYDDGVHLPRSRSADGSPLPPPRPISNNVLLDVNQPDELFTSSVMQWAQFIDHEFAHVPFPTLENGDGIECCPNGTQASGTLSHPRCFPIDLTGDPFYGPLGSTCMNFVRSMVAVGVGSACAFGYADELNQLTHWIDASMVYGSTAEEERELRAGQNGLLKVSANNLLPINPNQGGSCEARVRGAKCFMAGDSRVNEQPGLTALHTLLVRQHNLVARDLKALNPQWSDNALFQETRRIIIAQTQHIIFNEWLPIILGKDFMKSFGLTVLRSGFSADYNPNINPNMNSEFSTAAFRFGHTLVQGTLRLFTPSGGVDTIRMRDHFNSPHLIETQGRLDDIVRSLTQLAIQKYDSFITQDLSNHLFQTPRFNFGMDLMSLNIQRGRDHGIATYNSMRQVCGLPRARTFNDLTDQISPENVQKLARIYKNVDDIDLFVGGITENSVRGGLLGWTFLCIVGDQFARLKKGDRYFYDLGGQAGSFTEPQLQQIRASSWARIICDTANVPAVQPLAFRQTNSRFNQPVPCNNPAIPRPNWAPWKGERPAV